MGEMTIRIDDALLVKLNDGARTRGVDIDSFVADILNSGMQRHLGLEGLRALQAAQPNVSPYDSVDLIREDRDR